MKSGTSTVVTMEDLHSDVQGFPGNINIPRPAVTAVPHPVYPTVPATGNNISQSALDPNMHRMWGT